MIDDEMIDDERKRMDKGLYRLSVPTPYPVGPVNLYLIPGDEPVLVDAGPGTDEAWNALAQGLAEHNLQISDIRHLVITHAHLDHYGLAGRIVAESGACVYAHPHNEPLLVDFRNEWKRITQFYGEVMIKAGVPLDRLMDIGQHMQRSQSFNTQPVTVGRFLHDGDTLDLAGGPWEILHTPGHAMGAICLYQRQQRCLITGDHLLPEINSNPVVEPPPAGCEERPRSLVDYLNSLERIAALDVRIAYPGHGDPIGNPRELIARRIAHRRNRTKQVQALLTDEGQTVYQLAQQVFGPNIPRDQLFLMISEVLGHLDVLEVRGVVQMSEVGNVWLYRRCAEEGVPT